MNRNVVISQFLSEMEDLAIERIRKFAKIASTMGFEICLGFSGGKDSQVTYDLCKRSGIAFKSYFNHSFESPMTRKFIREHYPDVLRRRDYKFGFIENVWRNHGGLLPTVQKAYCCNDYKHNSKYVDACSITGVRRSESRSRKERTTFEAKNKTVLKKNKSLIDDYFEEHCQSVGNASIIQLKPIIDWTDNDVWSYIYSHNLPINPEYNTFYRIGCMVCPKANFNSNGITLIEYPKLIDAFIRAKDKGAPDGNWIITSDNKDYSDDKPYYICRWLNHSFMPFTKRNQELYEKVRAKYDSIKRKE